MPLGLLAMGGVLVLLATGSRFTFVAVLACFALTVAWNGYVLVRRQRLRRQYEARASRASIRPGTGGPVGRMAPAHAAPGVPARFARGLRSIAWSTQVSATSSASLLEVQSALARAADRAGAAFSWHPVPDGIAVEWRVRPANIRNQMFMRCTGQVRTDGTRTTFAGRITPDAIMRVSIIHMVVFGAGGIIAIVVCLGGFAFGTGDRSGFAFLLVWGTFGSAFCTSWIWSHAKAYEAHLAMLHDAFGASVILGEVRS